MLYLFWSLLNIALGILFLFICIRATKLIRENLGIIAAIVFVFALLSFVSSPNYGSNKDHKTGMTRSWDFHSPDSVRQINLTSFTLERNWVSTFNLEVEYGKDKNSGLNIPVSAFSNMTGIQGGYVWKPVSINLYSTSDDHKLRYSVYGTVEWKLLGLTIYHQGKAYGGNIEIK
jgi:hypothetical protein